MIITGTVPVPARSSGELRVSYAVGSPEAHILQRAAARLAERPSGVAILLHIHTARALLGRNLPPSQGPDYIKASPHLPRDQHLRVCRASGARAAL